MPSVAIPETIIAVSAATATGELTVASNVGLYPGTLGWLSKLDGSAGLRVKLVRLIGTTKVLVRAVADGRETNVPAPSYGLTSVSAFNLTSQLCIESQVANIDPAFSARNIG